MIFTEEEVKKVVDQVIAMPVFDLECRDVYMGKRDYIGMLTMFMNDFNEFLCDFLGGNGLDDMNAVQFVDALHKFFALGYTTKDGERDYSFAYDGNSGGKHYDADESLPLVANSKNKNRILAHTFMSLVDSGSNGVRRAICSGYTELACIMAGLYGYECIPLIAMCQVEDGPHYEFAHYLCALDDDGKPILIDLQQIDDLYETAKQNMNNFHCNLLFINPNTNEFATFNQNKLIHGGLGEDVIKLVKENIENGNTKPLSFVLDIDKNAPKGLARVIDVQKIEGSPTLTEAISKIVGNKEKKV